MINPVELLQFGFVRSKRDPSGSLTGLMGTDGLKVPLAGNAVRNVTRDNLARWRKARSNVLAGLGRAKIAVITDSTGTGQGSAGVGNNSMAGACLKSWPSMLAKALNSMGVPARFSASFADQGNTANGTSVPSYDPRIALGGGWTYTPGFTMNTVGGSALRFPASGTLGTFSFTPADSFDSVDIFYYGSASNGAVNVAVDGGAAVQSVNTAQATSGVYKATVTGIALGTHRLDLTPTDNTKNVFILGIDTYNSTKPDVQIFNWAQRSSKVADFTQTASPWSTLNNYSKFGHDLTIVVLTTNDCNNLTNIDTYAASMDLLVSTLLAANSDVILAVGFPGSSANIDATMASYVAKVKALAIKYGLPFMSFQDRFGAYADAYARGYMSDILHPTAPCYADTGFMAAQGLALSGDYF
jgi:hypothetical protein